MRFFKSASKVDLDPKPTESSASPSDCATVAGGQARLDSNGKIVQQLAIDLETLLVVKDINS